MWPSPHNGYSYSSDDDSSQQASYLGNSIFLLVRLLLQPRLCPASALNITYNALLRCASFVAAGADIDSFQSATRARGELRTPSLVS